MISLNDDGVPTAPEKAMPVMPARTPGVQLAT